MLFMTAEWFLWQRSGCCRYRKWHASSHSEGSCHTTSAAGYPLQRRAPSGPTFPCDADNLYVVHPLTASRGSVGHATSRVWFALRWQNELAGARRCRTTHPPSVASLARTPPPPLPPQVRPLLSMLFYRSSCPSACKSCRQRCRRDGRGSLCHRPLDTLDCRRQPLHLHPTLPAAAPPHCQRLLRRQSATAVGLGRRRCRHLGRHGRRHRFPRAPPSRPAASWTSSWTYGRTPSLHRSFTRETFFV